MTLIEVRGVGTGLTDRKELRKSEKGGARITAKERKKGEREKDREILPIRI
jgi:hypothetical protein